MRRILLLTLAAASFAALAGCAMPGPATPLAENERQYCRPGSMLKYRRPQAGGFGSYWIPLPPGGSCKGY